MVRFASLLLEATAAAMMGFVIPSSLLFAIVMKGSAKPGAGAGARAAIAIEDDELFLEEEEE